MATLDTPLPYVAFPWELDTLTFRSAGVSDTISIKLTYGDNTIFEEELYFDVDGAVVLDQLSSLLMDYDTHKTETFEVIHTEGSATSHEFCQVIPNSTSTERASEIVNKSFLTLLTGAKHSAPDGTEVISFYSVSDDELLNIEATYITADGNCLSYAEKRQLPIKIGDVSSFAINFSTLAIPEGATLAKVVLRVGERRQEYIINPSLTYSLRFLNSFGQEDVVYFTELEREAKPVRSLAMIGDVQRTYLVVPDTKITGTTIPLMDSELAWAEDAANAVYLRDSEDRTVSLTDSEFTFTTSPQDLPQLRLTWKLAQQKYRFQRSVRTFDFTFDTTYL